MSAARAWTTKSHAIGLERDERGRSACRCWPRRAGRARSHLAAGAERPPGLGSDWRRHRGPRARAGPPHADRPAQGRQGRHGASGTTHGQGGRPGHRRAPGRAHLHRRRTGGASTAMVRAGSCGALPVEPGSTSRSARTLFAMPSSRPPSTPAYRSATSRRRQATPTRGRPCATTEPGSPLTATLPTSSPRTSPGPVVRKTVVLGVCLPRPTPRQLSLACPRSPNTCEVSIGSESRWVLTDPAAYVFVPRRRVYVRRPS